jgi:hypothetical protein
MDEQSFSAFLSLPGIESGLVHIRNGFDFWRLVDEDAVCCSVQALPG